MLMRQTVAILLGTALAAAGAGNELHFCLRIDPKTFNPLQAEDEGSLAVSYLTGGVLIRMNRYTKELEGELAPKWKVSENGRRIDFELRRGVRFSDGTAFTCDDVAYTMRQLMDPNLHAPAGEPFRSTPGEVETKCTGPYAATVRFPGAVADLAGQFDSVAMLSAHSPQKESAVLGPFELGEYKPGEHVLLRRNPNYWKRDANGRALPYLDAIRLDIQQNRELELLRFRRGEIDLINKLDPEMFDRLSSEMPRAVTDAGPSLDWETVFFNQVSSAPIPDYKRRWFQSADFRRAISEAIRRDDIVRIVYHGHARAASGPVSSANHFWVNSALKPASGSETAAMALLQRAGFHRSGSNLVDAAGNKVEFSMITNAGNKLHERMLALIQQDLARVGIQLNTVVLDFPSLAERISRSYNYESVLMAWVNIDVDPSAQMNIWMSSAANHQWNPSEKTPQTSWEAEMDKWMREQNESQDPNKRKAAFDRVQQIVADQAPMLFLVNPNALAAVSPNVKNATAAVLGPQTFWNAERLQVSGALVSQAIPAKQ
jgi:peptide/nickel transport system substrate-binding protein